MSGLQAFLMQKDTARKAETVGNTESLTNQAKGKISCNGKRIARHTTDHPGGHGRLLPTILCWS
jgi:hypothetical protein